MSTAVTLALAVGVAWSIAPSLGRASGLPAMIMVGMIAVGTLVPTVPAAMTQGLAGFTMKQLGLAFASGVVNGLGLLAFYRIIAGGNEGLWDVSGNLAIAMVLVPIGIAILARVCFGDVITNERMIGIGMAAGAIWFLR